MRVLLVLTVILIFEVLSSICSPCDPCRPPPCGIPDPCISDCKRKPECGEEVTETEKPCLGGCNNCGNPCSKKKNEPTRRRRGKRMKRQSSDATFTYPDFGTWYRDNENCRYYFKYGNTAYVETPSGFYENWVTSGNGSGWIRNDRELWSWDKNGRWYSVSRSDIPNNAGSDVEKCDKPPFGIPFNCIRGNCETNVQFPRAGVWSSERDVPIYTLHHDKYELQSNGFYKKYLDGAPTDGHWTWDFKTGEWFSLNDEDVKNSKKLECIGGKKSGSSGRPTKTSPNCPTEPLDLSRGRSWRRTVKIEPLKPKRRGKLLENNYAEEIGQHDNRK